MDTLILARDARAPGLTRRYVKPRLHALGFPEDSVDELLIATSEAVTNAVMHGGPAEGSPGPDQVSVTLSVEGPALVIAVTSPRTGWTVSAPTLPEPTAESGRGLFVIQSFTDAWMVRQSPRGTTVYLSRRLPPSAQRRGERAGTSTRRPRATAYGRRPPAG